MKIRELTVRERKLLLFLTLGKLRVALATDDRKIMRTVGNKKLKIAGCKDKSITMHHLHNNSRREMQRPHYSKPRQISENQLYWSNQIT